MQLKIRILTATGFCYLPRTLPWRSGSLNEEGLSDQGHNREVDQQTPAMNGMVVVYLLILDGSFVSEQAVSAAALPRRSTFVVTTPSISPQSHHHARETPVAGQIQVITWYSNLHSLYHRRDESNPLLV